MPRRSSPQPIADAMAAFTARLEPATLLASVQRVWAGAVGEAIAAQARPTAARAGALTVTCSSSVWAQELDLMGPELVARVNAALGGDQVRSLRCQAAPSRGWAASRSG